MTQKINQFFKISGNKNEVKKVLNIISNEITSKQFNF